MYMQTLLKFYSTNSKLPMLHEIKWQNEKTSRFTSINCIMSSLPHFVQESLEKRN